MSVEVVTPSAVTEAGRRLRGLSSADVAGRDVTLAVRVTVIESVASVAVYVVVSATASLMVKVATPAALETLETVVIVEEPPDLASVTVCRRWGSTARSSA